MTILQLFAMAELQNRKPSDDKIIIANLFIRYSFLYVKMWGFVFVMINNCSKYP
ncbi:hypothetical protein GCD22_03341 [Acidithiobacillus thiooxidans ATCC 19377]|uniref:Uncharacterized protein n=1 Tax=Acidithiobacillus thiooxidans ATCC 19377 TaxID=637390 RepID=A0A5P9XTL6_ACITH|nr:hypothetical protein GCD22_03341 [Acidithiobacillus thiooxidans ATCC 19377]